MGILADQKRRKANKEAAKQRCRDYVATHSCTDCGESDPVVLTFDHVRSAKKGNISDMVNNGWSIETIVAEIAKCDVVCFNCHIRGERNRRADFLR